MLTEMLDLALPEIKFLLNANWHWTIWRYRSSNICPPLFHDQLKTVALEAWDWIPPQGEPTGSYIKILQGPNETYADFLARLETALSCTVIGEAQRLTRKITCLWKCKSGMSKDYSPNLWYRDNFWLFEGLSQYKIRNSKDANAG